MRPAPDIVAYSADRRLVLVVEVKGGGKETTPQNAARFRRNLLAHALIADAPFFLLAFPTDLFLWSPMKKGIAELPDFSAPAKEVLREYLGSLADQQGGHREESLQIALKSWLGDLATGIREPRSGSEVDQMLVNSGLYEEIKRGEVRSEAAS